MGKVIHWTVLIAQNRHVRPRVGQNVQNQIDAVVELSFWELFRSYLLARQVPLQVFGWRCLHFLGDQCHQSYYGQVESQQAVRDVCDGAHTTGEQSTLRNTHRLDRSSLSGIRRGIISGKLNYTCEYLRVSGFNELSHFSAADRSPRKPNYGGFQYDCPLYRYGNSNAHDFTLRFR